MTGKLILAGLMIFAATEFAVRGVSRALSDSGDFAMPYLSAGVWLRGGNPYDYDQLYRRWQEAGGALDAMPVRLNTPAVYPPTALLVIAPLTIFSWPAARLIVTGINTFALLLSILAIASVAGLRFNEWRGQLFLTLALAFAPLHTGLAKANLIVPAAAALFFAVWASEKRKDLPAGILIAVSMALKPQVGAILLLGYAIQRRWRICATAIILLAAISGVSLLRLDLAQVDWLSNFLSNSAEFAAAGGSNDPTSANPSRHHLINLQPLLYTIFDQAVAVNLIVIAIICGLFLLFWLNHRGIEADRHHLLMISFLASLNLLPIYHRFYDATLLLLPIAWGLKNWDGPDRRRARWSLGLTLPFLIPGAVFLQESIRAGRLPSSIIGAWWWNSLIMPHQVWAIILIAICLAWGNRQD